DLQPRSVLSPISIFDRLELHDRYAHPFRNRGIAHSVACLENTGDHPTDIHSRGQSIASIPLQSRDLSRSSAHPSRRWYLCHYESFLRKPYRISFLDNAPDSRLRHPRIPDTLSCLRPSISRTELSVLGRALSCRSDSGRLASHPRRKARFHGTASQNPRSEVMADRLAGFQNTNLLGRDLSQSDHVS